MRSVISAITHFVYLVPPTFLVLLLFLLHVSCNILTFVDSYTFDNDALKTAVGAWLENQILAFETYGHISSWDVSKVTDMSFLFYQKNFNDDVSSWDTSSVTSMYWMFASSTFNQPLNSWNTSSVRNMVAMFYYNGVFNQPLDSWNTNLVTDMNFMFAVSPFNQPLNSWSTSNVVDMYAMFHVDMAFNQPLDSWDVSKVTDVGFMFASATNFGQCLPWDLTGKRTDYFLSNTNGATSGNCLTLNPTHSPVVSSWSPTRSPPRKPSRSPTHFPVICREKDTKKFLLTVLRDGKNVNPVTKTCKWLRKQRAERIANICSRVFGRDDVPAAKDACKKTCGTCYA